MAAPQQTLCYRTGMRAHARALLDAALQPHHELTWLFEPQASWRLLLEDLYEAHNRIDAQLYMLVDDEVGAAFVHALVAARQRGVAVRLLLDGVGSANTTMGLLDQLIDAGVELRVYGPVRLSVPWRRWLRRNHRKVFVIDGVVAHVTGRNVGNVYYGEDHPTSGRRTWLDAGVRVRGPVVAELAAHLHMDWEARLWATEPLQLRQLWRHDVETESTVDARRAMRKARQLMWHLWSTRGTPLARAERQSAEAPAPPPAVRVRDMPALPEPGSRVWAAWNLGHAKTAHANLLYLRAIRQCNTELWLAQSYFVPDRALRRALVFAGRRGVRVHLLLPDPAVSDLPWVSLAGQHALGDILEAGARVWYVPERMLHAKLGVFDRSLWTVGSANLDPLSRQRNLELNLVGRGEHEAAALQGVLERWTENAHLITLAAWRARPLKTRLVERALWSLRGLYQSLG